MSSSSPPLFVFVFFLPRFASSNTNKDLFCCSFFIQRILPFTVIVLSSCFYLTMDPGNNDSEHDSDVNNGDIYDRRESVGYHVRRVKRRTNLNNRHDSLTNTMLFSARHLLEWLQFFLVRNMIEMNNYSFAACMISLFKSVKNLSELPKKQLLHLWGSILIMSSVMADFYMFQAHCCYLTVCDILFYAQDGTSRQRHHIAPKRHRRIDDFDNYTLYDYTGFNKAELRHLIRQWRLPMRLSAHPHGRRTSFTSEECVIMFLHHTRHGVTYLRMRESFGGDPRHYCYVMRCIVSFLYRKFYHKITGRSMRMWTSSQQVDTFRKAILERLQKNAHRYETRHFPFRTMLTIFSLIYGLKTFAFSDLLTTIPLQPPVLEALFHAMLVLCMISNVHSTLPTFVLTG
jgi:hypothetical protein